MDVFRHLLWQEMKAHDMKAANMLETVVKENLSGREDTHWTTYCTVKQDCQLSTSPLMEIRLFIRIFCKALVGSDMSDPMDVSSGGN